LNTFRADIAMSSTNQAFIKAFRRDAARSSTPPPASAPAPSKSIASHRSVISHIDVSQEPSPWHTSVEFVGPAYRTELAPLLPPAIEMQSAKSTRPVYSEPAIGRRPLSAFMNRADVEQPATEPPHADRAFQPGTTVPAFRWPSICRAAWQRSAADYERVAKLLTAQRASERRLIGVAGLHPGDGCTTTLLCLAAAATSTDRRLIIVDANFRSPQLAAQLGVEPTAAWQDVLAHGLAVDEAVIRAEDDRVDLLPLDGRRLDGPKLVAGLQTSVTAGVLRYAYDLVLLDLGAILAPSSFATTVHLLQNMQIDGALLIADPRQTEQSDLAMAADLLQEHGCEPLGMIENRAA
jgi:Mrp family chromosome partitioning ATPase